MKTIRNTLSIILIAIAIGCNFTMSNEHSENRIDVGLEFFRSQTTYAEIPGIAWQRPGGGIACNCPWSLGGGCYCI